MEVLREKIAREVQSFQWDSRTDISDAEEIADRILALPEIAAGQKLLMVEVRLGEFDMSSAFKEPQGTREPE